MLAPGYNEPGCCFLTTCLYVGTANVLENDLDYHTQEGFIQTFQADDLSVLLANFETTPTGQGGGFWQAGRGIAADASGNVFVAVDSGMYNPLMSFAPSVLKFSQGTLSPVSWFTPANWDSLYYDNLDLSANGVTLIPNTDVAFAGGKAGVIYLVNQTNLGGLEPGRNTPLQEFQASHGCGTTDCGQHLPTAYWPRPNAPYLYVWDVQDYLRAYPFDLQTRRFLVNEVTVGSYLPSRVGGMTVSSNGGVNSTGIVWATTTSQDASNSAVPGTLRAYNANDISDELYDSDQVSTRDAMGTFVKMSTPVVANGKVYVNTQSNELPVYGLLCQQSLAAEVSIMSRPLEPGPGANQLKQQLVFLNNGTAAIGGPFTLVLSGLSAGATPAGLSGKTSCIKPAGNDFVEMPKAGPLWLKPGKSFTVELNFTLEGVTGVSYNPMLLAGSGGH